MKQKITFKKCLRCEKDIFEPKIKRGRLKKYYSPHCNKMYFQNTPKGRVTHTKSHIRERIRQIKSYNFLRKVMGFSYKDVDAL